MHDIFRLVVLQRFLTFECDDSLIQSKNNDLTFQKRIGSIRKDKIVWITFSVFRLITEFFCLTLIYHSFGIYDIKLSCNHACI